MNARLTHPAPRVPAGRDSLAAYAGPSRRAILGALAAGPIIGAAFVERLPDRMDWQTAVSNYRRDSAASGTHAYGRATPGTPGYAALKAEANHLMAISEASLAAVMAMPAPDVAAAIEKLEIWVNEYGDFSEKADDVLSVATDLRRLAAEGR